jgi:hypothetical protein
VAQYRVVEICAGAGGQSLGLELAGFEHGLSVEFTGHRACNTLLRRGFTTHTCVRRWRVRFLRFKTEDGPAPSVGAARGPSGHRGNMDTSMPENRPGHTGRPRA